MAKFRKGATLVDAVHWNGYTLGIPNKLSTKAIDPHVSIEVPSWMPKMLPPLETEALTRISVAPGQIRRYIDYLHIGTPDGVVAAAPGDWIIKDENGIYPCTSDVFKATYERVE